MRIRREPTNASVPAGGPQGGEGAGGPAEEEKSGFPASVREGRGDGSRGRMSGRRHRRHPMFEFVHDADTDRDAPAGEELLAEAGLDPRAIREVLARPDGE